MRGNKLTLILTTSAIVGIVVVVAFFERLFLIPFLSLWALWFYVYEYRPHFSSVFFISLVISLLTTISLGLILSVLAMLMLGSMYQKTGRMQFFGKWIGAGILFFVVWVGILGQSFLLLPFLCSLAFGALCVLRMQK